MKKWIIVSVVLGFVAGANAALIEDFEGDATLGATEVQLTNTMVGSLTNAPAGAAGLFGSQSVLLSKGTGNFAAFRTKFGAATPGETLQISFDLYVADAGAITGDYADIPQVHRIEWSTLSADRHDITYTGTFVADNLYRYTSSIVVPDFLDDGTTAVDEVRLFVNFNGSVANSSTDWGYLDNISVIPEPATLGLVAAFGGGILFIRRRLMI